MEVICTNGHFTAKALEIYAEYGVSIPVEDGVYSIRELVHHHLEGKKGLRLNELQNPEIPIGTAILGHYYSEPTFSIFRFRHLDRSSITEEEIREIIKKQNRKIDQGISCKQWTKCNGGSSKP